MSDEIKALYESRVKEVQQEFGGLFLQELILVLSNLKKLHCMAERELVFRVASSPLMDPRPSRQ